ncbi:MAG: winged helix-turn-helix transcriptional regulator [Deltaproteobacteria bacterium]|nr:winged helix-turn-helix transcriptional regulator [Deltaproteobacteria bacterium]
MKQSVFELQAEICKTLANPKRLEIIACLRGDELSAGALAKKLGIAKANLSQHLAVLRARGIVIARRDGVKVYYRISSPRITEACAMMKSVLMEQFEDKGRTAKEMKGRGKK